MAITQSQMGFGTVIQSVSVSKCLLWKKNKIENKAHVVKWYWSQIWVQPSVSNSPVVSCSKTPRWELGWHIIWHLFLLFHSVQVTTVLPAMSTVNGAAYCVLINSDFVMVALLCFMVMTMMMLLSGNYHFMCPSCFALFWIWSLFMMPALCPIYLAVPYLLTYDLEV